MVPGSPSGSHRPGAFDQCCGYVALCWAAAVAVWICFTSYPQLQDFPEWIYQGYLLAEIIRGDAQVTSQFALTSYPVPNSFAQLILGVFSLVVPAVIAGKILIIAYVAGFTRLLMHWTRQVDPANAGKLLLVGVVAVALNSSFWNGYLNFQFSLLFLAAFLYVWDVRRQQSPWIVLTFALLIFFTHAITFAVFTLDVILSAAVAKRWQWRFQIALALIPAACLTAWYALAHANSLGRSLDDPAKDAGSSLASLAAYKLYTIAKQGPFHVFEFPDGTTHLTGYDSLYWLGVGANVAFAIAICLCLALACVTLFRRRTEAISLAALCLFSVTALGFLVAPQFAIGIVNPGERLLLPGLLAMLGAAALPRRLLTCVCLIAIAGLPLTALFLLDGQQPKAARESPGAKNLFVHRARQFDAKGQFVLHPANNHLLPLGFDTSIIQERPAPTPPPAASP